MSNVSHHESLIPAIESKIYAIRGRKVMLAQDLAQLYGVAVKNLNKAVSRNLDRFPEDFSFKLTKEEAQNLKFQSGTSSWGGVRKEPRAFTEHGILMLSSILRSKRAVKVNIQIMRTFIKIRQMLSSNQLLREKIDELEKKYGEHDKQFKAVFDTIRRFTESPVVEKPKRSIGFHVKNQIRFVGLRQKSSNLGKITTAKP